MGMDRIAIGVLFGNNAPAEWSEVVALFIVGPPAFDGDEQIGHM